MWEGPDSCGWYHPCAVLPDAVRKQAEQASTQHSSMASSFAPASRFPSSLSFWYGFPFNDLSFRLCKPFLPKFILVITFHSSNVSPKTQLLFLAPSWAWHDKDVKHVPSWLRNIRGSKCLKRHHILSKQTPEILHFKTCFKRGERQVFSV